MRIYSKIDFVEGRIPGKEDFKTALNEFEEDCILPFLRRGVVGSFPYGSVNRRDCSVSSDIDYFILISDEEHKKRIRNVALNALDKKNVYVQTRVIHIDHARNGLHRIDDSFRQHLEFTIAKYGNKGENPLEILSSSKIPFKRALQTSMGIYLMKLNNGFCSASPSESAYLDFLKDIMEKPWHAMRVSIQHALGSIVPEGEEFEDTKEQLIRVYKGLGYDDRLIDDIDKIRAIALQYVQLLERRKSGDIGVKNANRAYSEFLPRIEDCYNAAYHFIDGNARIITTGN